MTSARSYDTLANHLAKSIFPFFWQGVVNLVYLNNFPMYPRSHFGWIPFLTPAPLPNMTRTGIGTPDLQYKSLDANHSATHSAFLKLSVFVTVELFLLVTSEFVFQVACPPGTYAGSVRTPNASMCPICEAGFYCPIGTITMEDCPRGYYCVEAQSKAEPCPIGTYGNRSSKLTRCMWR